MDLIQIIVWSWFIWFLIGTVTFKWVNKLFFFLFYSTISL